MSDETKRAYRELCRTESTIPVFSTDWWLDAACGPEGWDVAIATRNDHIVGTMPYPIATRMRFRVITMPKLTQKLGPWLRYPPGASTYDRLTFDKDVLTDLIDQLPRFDLFSQQFDYRIQNWLPFYWKGFQQTTLYTYVIDDISDVATVVAGFEHSKRKNLHRAEKVLTVAFDMTAEAFYQHHEMTLAKQGDVISYGRDLFMRLHGAAAFHDAGTIICAQRRPGCHPQCRLRDLGCQQRLRSYQYDRPGVSEQWVSCAADSRACPPSWRARRRDFDFEGSMIEPVEESFRRFGADQRGYFLITKSNSATLDALVEVRGVASVHAHGQGQAWQGSGSCSESRYCPHIHHTPTMGLLGQDVPTHRVARVTGRC